ncbi:cytochrome c biogenesis protein ResB [Methylomonas rivi]|uniref:Cytochrome c biogenesis protein ResB n=1 Tax=Methylomonas rivi TaxID=2952226 RepID=A0ABT1U208_9GAMM|nr:cytochrome c biogenesis protein ResB [Methylomonas sp. WSC-6]MCQ8127858.1 cytochrome c biogenesis protein ResB [Methylomonas sp. WSC-6]
MPQSTFPILPRFSGSMNLAIAVAAAIGTVVQQNQPYPDYVLKFGPFNVNPDPGGEKKFVNLGPSFQYKLRQADEYPTLQPHGRLFYLRGGRHSTLNTGLEQLLDENPRIG